MQFIKKHWIKIIIPISCIIAIILALVPKQAHADSMSDFNWTVYTVNGPSCCSVSGCPVNHVVLNTSGGNNSVAFTGHTQRAYFEFALANPGDRDYIQNEFFNFTLDLASANYHTVSGAGFLFNVDLERASGTINSGYFASYEFGNRVVLYRVNNATIANWSGHLTQIASIQGDNVTLHQISVQATASHVLFIDNNKVLFDMDIPVLPGTQFGPGIAWGGHSCSMISRAQFTQVQCGINKKAPIADFNYNMPVADIKTKVYVTYSAQDLNTPASPLTYLWTVVKINEDGTRTTLCTDSSTPFTRYNENGIGIYETTLRVKNGYYFFAPPVTKRVEITTMPTIEINPEKTQYYPGEKVKFKSDKWYNCSSSTSNIVIENVVSKNLYNPVVGLVGSSAITSVSGDLTVDVLFEYSDGTSASKTVAVPAAGTTVSDTSNASKQVSKITVTYRNIPRLAELSAGNYLTYEYETKNPLSNYYAGGAMARRYEASNTVTCKIDLGSKVVTASDSATTNFVERFASFSLSGTVDNRNAVTKPPVCNTEFLLTGLSYGGENVANYMVVTNGESQSIRLPYGEYVLNEDSGFTLGYDLINPISIVIDDKGITVDGKTVIPDNGKIPFVKPLQVAIIDISRVYESFADISLKSDTDFKVVLKGTPVVDEIEANFELISPKDDETYYYNGNVKSLVVPIGTYSVDETQRYRLTALQDIHVGDELLWDSTLNARKNAELGRVTFVASKNQSSSVVLKYISDEYVYGEDVYNNGIFISVKLRNHEGEGIVQSNIDRIIVNPSKNKYPVTLKNVDTEEEYCAIIDGNSGKAFGYMYPGQYEIICANNMYMDLDEMRELNSDNLEFTQKGGKYYLNIPRSSAYGEYEELTRLTDWRGYSSISASFATMHPEMNSHVSFYAKAYDQDGDPVPNVEFSIYDEDGSALYFKERDSRWYPADEADDGAVSVFKTGWNGEFHIYKFPEGEYVIKEKSPSDTIYAITPVQTIVVDGARNMGIEMEFSDTAKVRKPTSVNLNVLKSEIDIGEELIIANKTIPAIAYKNVSLSSSNNSVISVSNTGVVTGISRGTAVITAKSTLDGTTLGQIELTVYDSSDPDMRDLRQTVSNIRLEVGEAYAAKAVYCPANVKNPPITWSSANTSIAAVSSTGVITAKGVGTTNITASYNGFTAICRVTVGKTEVAVKSVEFVDDNIQLVYNNEKLSSGQVEVVVLPETASDPSVTFESSDPDIVSVDADGHITAKSAGVVTITATTTNGISSTCLVSSVPIVESITLNMSSITLTKGSASKVSASVEPVTALNAGDLVWESSDPKIATVNNNGEITAIAVGQTTVMVTVAYPGADDVTTECIVTVVTDEVAPTNLDVDYDEDFGTTSFDAPIEMEIGSQKEFFTRVRPAAATILEIEWTYSRSRIIEIGPADPDDYSTSKVINKWKIDAVGTTGGEVTVTGKIKGTNISTQFKVIVDAPGTGFEFNMESPQTLIIEKSPYDVLAIGIIYDNPWSSARNITWELSDTSKASLSYPDSSKINANVTALQPGVVTLKATVQFRFGGTYTKTMQIIIKGPEINVMVGDTIVKEITVNQGETVDFVVEPNYPKLSANDGYEISINNNNVSVAGNGKNTPYGLGYSVTGLTPGVTMATITPTDTAVKPITVKFTVPGISIIPSTSDDGTIKLALQATAVSVAGDVEWSSEDPDIATVDEFGNVTPVANGTATFTAAVDGMTAQLTLNFEGLPEVPPPSISPINIVTQTSNYAQLSVTTKNLTEDVQWSSSAPRIATVNENGKVICVEAGTVTITASADGISREIEITFEPYAELFMNGKNLDMVKYDFTIVSNYSAAKSGTWTCEGDGVGNLSYFPDGSPAYSVEGTGDDGTITVTYTCEDFTDQVVITYSGGCYYDGGTDNISWPLR